MKNKFWLWTALFQTVLVLVFAVVFSLKEAGYFVFALASIVQFALLQQNKMRYFTGFTVIYALISVLFMVSGRNWENYLSGLLWFFWIAVFTFLIYNMLQTEQYKKLYFGSFILWLIAFGAVYAGMEFINILLLKIETMPGKLDIAPYFTGKMRIGIIMGIALGLGYDILQFICRFMACGEGEKDD